jgi:hypothetical protein
MSKQKCVTRWAASAAVVVALSTALGAAACAPGSITKGVKYGGTTTGGGVAVCASVSCS